MKSFGLRRVFLTLAICAASAASAGCDPGGVGASGEIKLGPGVSTEGFTTLKMCASPEPEEPPASGFPETCEIAKDEALSEVEFPHAYEISAGIGTSDHERWLFVVWLTADAKSTTPAKGEPFGSTIFSVGSCTGTDYVEEYCGITAGIDITLNGGAGGS